MKVRLHYLDYAKGIGIILVVLGHVMRGIDTAGLPINESFFRHMDALIYSFHMPLFFFVSGLFFVSSLSKAGNLERFSIQKAKLILYPYLIWSVIQTGIEIIMAKYTNGNVGIGALLSIPFEPRAQFWFLYELFKMVLISGIVFTTCGKAAQHICAALGVVFLWMHYNTEIMIVHHYYIYFVAGFYLRNVMTSHTESNSLATAALTTTFFAVALFSINSGIYKQATIGLILAPLGVAATCLISMWLARQNLVSWLEVVGKLSLPIYLAHIIAGSGIRVALKMAGITSPYIHIPAGVAVGVILPMIAYFVCTRFKMKFFFEWKS